MSITIGQLLNRIAELKASGQLTDSSEIRIHTGWEGPEHLPAAPSLADDETPGAPYLLLRQP